LAPDSGIAFDTAIDGSMKSALIRAGNPVCKFLVELIISDLRMLHGIDVLSETGGVYVASG
jgi:hypothetical protein